MSEDEAALPEENVWDYPRPPRLERVPWEVVVRFGGLDIARSIQAHRVLETSHPPTYYVPRSDIRMDLLVPGTGRSFCEFKGRASYWSLRVDGRESLNAAWSYQDPTAAYADIAEDLSFY
ncbi:MAG: DUF427 domain-containing protein, partial [Rhodospirillaceae bacterium]